MFADYQQDDQNIPNKEDIFIVREALLLNLLRNNLMKKKMEIGNLY